MRVDCGRRCDRIQTNDGTSAILGPSVIGNCKRLNCKSQRKRDSLIETENPSDQLQTSQSGRQTVRVGVKANAHSMFCHFTAEILAVLAVSPEQDKWRSNGFDHGDCDRPKVPAIEAVWNSMRKNKIFIAFEESCFTPNGQ